MPNHTHDKLTVVLVHGAWADGSSWNKVSTELQRRGFKVVAAQLPLKSLSDDVTALRRVLRRQDALRRPALRRAIRRTDRYLVS